MKIISKVNLTCLLLSALCLLASCGGGPGERIKQIAAITPTPAPPPTEREISGVFNVTGAGENGNDPYTGVLNIAPQGDVYGFRWTTTHGAHNGVGVQLGDATAASYANPGSGAGCGVVLYKIASDGSLDGRIARWGEEKFTTEKATRFEGRGLVGKYSVTGNGRDGAVYSGTLSVKKDGSGYDFELAYNEAPASMAIAPRIGFGIWKGSSAAVSFGGRQCSFALYDITSNGSLEGNWGGQKMVTFGTESAKRQ